MRSGSKLKLQAEAIFDLCTELTLKIGRTNSV